MPKATPNSPRPPGREPAASYRLSVPARPATVGLARAFVATVLEDEHAALVDDARLCVSEVVTNVVTHTQVPSLEVEIAIRAPRVVVSVRDESPLGLPEARCARAAEEHGRGLYLVHVLAARAGVDWECDRHHNIVGKRVWFQLHDSEGEVAP
ncbi:ATP-binding protein [Streptomyces gamaensis]|uniref:ATP-binding protein n=1 Tax=Streptomyces gamaensis TaxID=1763542 RepID=A0ABW0Z8L3_9ACTN